MNSLLKLAVFAAACYFVWDWYGAGWMKSLENAAGAAKERLGDVVTTKSTADFQLHYDARTRRFAITATTDGKESDGVALDMLALHLRSSSSLVPHVEVIYDATTFATGAEQAEFEENVRRQVERAKGRASFAAKGRPKSY